MTATELEPQLRQYFTAEKQESVFFVAFGVLSLVLAVLFFLRGGPSLRGAAFPVASVGLIQVVVGGAVWMRTDQQIADLLALVASAPARYVAEEGARMATVNKWFDVYKVIEIALLVVGVVLLVVGRAGGRAVLLGAGAGLAIQAAIMLTLDFFAEARANRYTAQIETFGKTL
jgi:hypothetical protein